MNEAEFEEEIDAADRKLAAQGMPVHQRSLRVFKMLASDYHGIVFGSEVRRCVPCATSRGGVRPT